MGMHTNITGHFSFNKPVDKELLEYINKFCDTRHMIRDVEKIKRTVENWQELCYKGNLGNRGEFYVGEEEYTAIDCNDSGEVPALNCGWCISEDGKYLEAYFAPYGYIYASLSNQKILCSQRIYSKWNSYL